jgi:hypothetical protein
MEYTPAPGHSEGREAADRQIYESVVSNIDTVTQVVEGVLSDLQPSQRERAFRADRAGSLSILRSHIINSMKQTIRHDALVEAYNSLSSHHAEIVRLRINAFQSSGLFDKRTHIRASCDRSTQQAADFFRARPQLNVQALKMQQTLQVEYAVVDSIDVLETALLGNIESERIIGSSDNGGGILHTIRRNIDAATRRDKTPLRFALNSVEWLVGETARLDTEIVRGEVFNEAVHETKKLRQLWAQLSGLG